MRRIAVPAEAKEVSLAPREARSWKVLASSTASWSCVNRSLILLCGVVNQQEQDGEESSRCTQVTIGIGMELPDIINAYPT